MGGHLRPIEEGARTITITAPWAILVEILMNGAGFNGIVVIGWGGAFRPWIEFRSTDGDHFGGTREP